MKYCLFVSLKPQEKAKQVGINVCNKDENADYLQNKWHFSTLEKIKEWTYQSKHWDETALHQRENAIG